MSTAPCRQGNLDKEFGLGLRGLNEPQEMWKTRLNNSGFPDCGPVKKTIGCTAKSPTVCWYAILSRGRVSWGRCYDHNILRKNGVFLKKQNNVMIPFSQNSAVFLSQKRQILAKIFGENIFKS
jgi:hypothetical protein